MKELKINYKQKGSCSMKRICLTIGLFLVLILGGCTSSQMNAWSQVAHGLSEVSEEYQQGTAKIMNQSMSQLPRSNGVTFGSNTPDQKRPYLVNTNKGLVYTECMTLSDNTVICY